MQLISSYNWFTHYLIVRKIVLFLSRTIFFGLELVHVCLQLFRTPLIRWRFYSYNEENSLGGDIMKTKNRKEKYPACGHFFCNRDAMVINVQYSLVMIGGSGGGFFVFLFLFICSFFIFFQVAQKKLGSIRKQAEDIINNYVLLKHFSHLVSFNFYGILFLK